jgi:FkbM family methyltransferase
VEHHPIFSHFKPEVEFISDSFLGTVSRREFTSEAMQEKVCARGPAGLPAFNEEYFEWIDLLESIKAWKPGSLYTFMELGAGYGRWSVRAAFARPLARIIAVEAEPTHYVWMKQNFEDNGLKGGRFKTIQAAVSDTPGLCGFLAGRPAEWYGQRIAEPGEDGRITPCVTLAELLKLVTLVDLIDMDIQGAEVRVIKAGIEELNSKVKRLHIATHDPETEVNLRRAFHQEGWRMARDFSGGGTNATPFGLIEFQDGVQSWVNKRFE